MERTILVVDDSPFEQQRASLLLKELGARIIFADNGKQGLEKLEAEQPDLVLTDLVMPELDGLELVQEVSQRSGAIPVILMTAQGSEEIAVKALAAGAASYVPKKNLAMDLVPVVEAILDTIAQGKEERKLLEWRALLEERFVFNTQWKSVSSLVGHLQRAIQEIKLCSEMMALQVGTVLTEAVTNAMLHGNLELDSQLREKDDAAYLKLAETRRTESPYCDRRVEVVARVTSSEAVYTITDDGPGFDTSKMADPTDPSNLGKRSGRGLFLIHAFMDEVKFNEKGNQITMIKRRAS